MEVKTNKLSDVKVEIKGELEWTEFRPYYDRALLVLGKEAKLKGFRPGKAPQDMIEKQIGQEKLMSKAVEFILQEQFDKQVKENNWQVAAPPKAEILKLAFNNDFSFRLTLEVLPEIILPDLKKVISAVKKPAIEIKDEEVDNALNWLRQTKASFKDLDRPAQEKDFIEIEYQSPEIENNKKFKDQFILGQAGLMPGFEKELIGLKKGEKKEFILTFPSDYFKKELANKKAYFQVQVLAVKEMILPELNDQFVQSLNAGKELAPQTLLELKQAIRAGMKKDREQLSREQWLGQVLEHLKDKTKITLPESLRQKDELEQDRIKTQLIVSELVKQAKIEISETEVDQAIQSFLTSYPQEQKNKVDLEKLKNYYKERAYQAKILNFLESNL